MPGPVMENPIDTESNHHHSPSDEDLNKNHPLLDGPLLEKDSEDDIEEEEEDKQDEAQGGNESSKRRSEKSSHNRMLKLGIEPITGITGITIERTDDVENSRSQMQIRAARLFRMPEMGAEMAKSDNATADWGAQKLDEEKKDDETGMYSKDVDLVMKYTGVSRCRAVKALKALDGNVLDAMMDCFHFVGPQ